MSPARNDVPGSAPFPSTRSNVVAVVPCRVARAPILMLLATSLAFHASGARATPARPTVGSDCRFASAVVDFSSEWSPNDWSAQQVIGPPNTYPNYGDISTAWASATANDQREFLVLAFDEPAPINFVNVYETWNPGAIDLIAVRNSITGDFETVWTGTAADGPPYSRVFTATFPQTPFPVSEVRIELDSPSVSSWNEVDAVAIGLCDYLSEGQWASAVVDFSSQIGPEYWSAAQALGLPDTYPTYGDIGTAWASLFEDAGREFLVLAYDTPRVISFVSVYETWNPGALDVVEVKNPGTGLFETVWTGFASVAPPAARIFTVSFPVTQFPVSQVRLEFDSFAVPGYNEVDAVATGRCVCSDQLVDVRDTGSAAFVLAAPRPNPFRRSTEIGFSLSREGPVRIEVFNALGQRVTRILDRTVPAGKHAVEWTGRDARGRPVENGLYFVRVDAAGLRRAHKVVKVE